MVSNYGFCRHWFSTRGSKYVYHSGRSFRWLFYLVAIPNKLFLCLARQLNRWSYFCSWVLLACLQKRVNKPPYLIKVPLLIKGFRNFHNGIHITDLSNRIGLPKDFRIDYLEGPAHFLIQFLINFLFR